MSWLDDALAAGPLLADGGMIGTLMLSRGLPPGASAERLNIEHSDLVEDLHRAYAEAGAQFLTTNTFRGSPFVLAVHGCEDLAPDVNRAGAEIARRAAGGRARVMGDVGPFGGFLEPYGDVTAEQLEEALRIQIGALVEAGVDGLIVETMFDPHELAVAVRVAKSLCDGPVLASYAFQKAKGEFRTMMGTSVAEAIGAAREAGADAVGANCGTDLALDDYLALADELLAHAGGLPVLVQPNAGRPRQEGEVIRYPARPEDLAAWAVRAVERGVSIVGGCCGTTPEHIRAVASALGRGGTS